jgi:hypothetical protein
MSYTLNTCFYSIVNQSMYSFASSGLRSEQPDHVLYQIDNELPLGSTSPSEHDSSMSTSVIRCIRKNRAPLNLNDLNTYKILQPHSSVPAVGIESVTIRPIKTITRDHSFHVSVHVHVNKYRRNQANDSKQHKLKSKNDEQKQRNINIH